MDEGIYYKVGSLDDFLNCTEKYLVNFTQSAPKLYQIEEEKREVIVSRGVATEVFRKFQHANSYIFPDFTKFKPDVYSQYLEINKAFYENQKLEFFKQVQPPPGVIDIRGNGKNERYVINIFSEDVSLETMEVLKQEKKILEVQERWFTSALKEIYSIKDLSSVAFYENVGCEYSYNWDKFRKIIEKFARNNQKVKTVMYVKQIIESSQKMKQKSKLNRLDDFIKSLS